MLLQPWRYIARAPTASPRLPRGIADLRPFREGDLVLLRRKDDRTAPPTLSRPLKPGRRIEGHKGVVRHDDILGTGVRDSVSTLPKRQRPGEDGIAVKQRAGTEYRLHEVKLEEYVRLTKRLVTPIYPADARLIVDLLDLHPHALLDGNQDEKLEILEAGTGHGSLTLYLARAICGANDPPPRNADADDLSAWRSRRRAVLHTIDVSEKYSHHAENIVRGFKTGLYHPHVDFHVGDVADWITTTFATQHNRTPFLSHAFLDLPGADAKIATVAQALRVDGTLIVFNPSITQIMDAAKTIKDDGVELELEKVVELGVNGGSGGREWDVRPVKPRATLKAEQIEKMDVAGESESEVETDREEEQVVDDAGRADVKDGWSMVCRPRVGDRVVGGGFLGVWKKQRTP